MQTLLTDIEAFCERHSVTPTKLGDEALNDKAFVHRLKDRKRGCWPQTEQKVRDWMADFERKAVTQ